MNPRFRTLFFIFLVAALSLSACNFPRPNATPSPSGVDAVKTAAALTVEAMITPSDSTPAPQTATPQSNTQPSQTPGATATQAPTAVVNTPIPTAIPTATTPPTPCDRAQFESETIPDGTSLSPGQTFTKTWTFKNTGTCTWNSSYAVVFSKGEAMGSPGASQVTTGTVAPGQTVQVSVSLKAPTAAGTFRGEWMLRNASNVLFGLGEDASAPFWVEIKVPGTTYSFITNMCSAEWKSSASTNALPCPGNTSDTNGFVVKVDNPVLETGQDNESALWTNPQAAKDGTISGKFPSITVTRGNHFKTVLGCLNNTPTCSVRFTLSYRADGGDETVLKTWDEKYDKQITKVDIDLSSLAGKSVSFILSVKAMDPNNYTQNQAFWLLPRIE